MLTTDHAIDPDPVQRLEQAVRIGEALREFAGAGVRLHGCLTRVTGNRDQGCPEGKLQLEFTSRPGFLVWQSVERRQSTSYVADGLPVC